MPDTVNVVNPRWRELDGQVRRGVAELARLKAAFGGLILQGEIEPEAVQEFVSRKQELQAQIQEQETKLAGLKAQRKEEERKISVSDLPPSERFEHTGSGTCSRSLAAALSMALLEMVSRVQVR